MDKTLWINLLLSVGSDVASQYISPQFGFPIPWSTSASLSTMLLSLLIPSSHTTEKKHPTTKSGTTSTSSALSEDDADSDLNPEIITTKLFEYLATLLQLEEDAVIKSISSQDSLRSYIDEMNEISSLLTTSTFVSPHISLALSRANNFFVLARENHTKMKTLDPLFSNNTFSPDSESLSTEFSEMITYITKKLSQLASENSSMRQTLSDKDSSSVSQSNKFDQEKTVLLAKISFLENDITSKEQSNTKLRNSLEKANNENTTLLATISSKDSKITALTAQKVDLESNVSNLEKKLKSQKEQITTLQSENTNKTNSIEDLEIKINSLGVNIAELESHTSSSAKDAASTITSLKDKTTKLTKANKSFQTLLIMSGISQTRAELQLCSLQQKLRKSTKLLQSQQSFIHGKIIPMLESVSLTLNSSIIGNSILISQQVSESMAMEESMDAYTKLCSRYSAHASLTSIPTSTTNINTITTQLSAYIPLLKEIPLSCNRTQTLLNIFENSSLTLFNLLEKAHIEITQSTDTVGILSTQLSSLSKTLEDSIAPILEFPVSSISQSVSKFQSLCQNTLIPAVTSLLKEHADLTRTEFDLISNYRDLSQFLDSRIAHLESFFSTISLSQESLLTIITDHTSTITTKIKILSTISSHLQSLLYESSKTSESLLKRNSTLASKFTTNLDKIDQEMIKENVTIKEFSGTQRISISNLLQIVNMIKLALSNAFTFISEQSKSLNISYLKNNNFQAKVNTNLTNITKTFTTFNLALSRHPKIDKSVKSLLHVIKLVKNALNKTLALVEIQTQTQTTLEQEIHIQQCKMHSQKEKLSKVLDHFFNFNKKTQQTLVSKLTRVRNLVKVLVKNSNSLQSLLLDASLKEEAHINSINSSTTHLDAFLLLLDNWNLVESSKRLKIQDSISTSLSLIRPNIRHKNKSIDTLVSEFSVLLAINDNGTSKYLTVQHKLTDLIDSIQITQDSHFSKTFSTLKSIDNNIISTKTKASLLHSHITSLETLLTNSVQDHSDSCSQLSKLQLSSKSTSSTLKIFSSVNTNRISATFPKSLKIIKALSSLTTYHLQIYNAFNEYYSQENDMDLDSHEQNMVKSILTHIEKLKVFSKQFIIFYSNVLTTAKKSILHLFTHFALLTKNVNSLSHLVSIYCTSSMEASLLNQLSDLSIKYSTLEAASISLLSSSQEISRVNELKQQQFQVIKNANLSEIHSLYKSQDFFANRLVNDYSARAARAKKLGSLTSVGFSSKNNMLLQFINSLTQDIGVLESQLLTRSKDLGIVLNDIETGKVDLELEPPPVGVEIDQKNDGFDLEFSVKPPQVPKSGSHKTSKLGHRIRSSLDSLEKFDLIPSFGSSDDGFGFEASGDGFAEHGSSLVGYQPQQPTIVYKTLLPVLSLDTLVSNQTLIKSIFDSWTMIQKMEDYIKTLVASMDTKSYVLESLLFTHHKNVKKLSSLVPNNINLQKSAAFQAHQISRLISTFDNRVEQINTSWKANFTTFSQNIVSVFHNLKQSYFDSQFPIISVGTVLDDLVDELDARIYGLSLHNFTLKPLPEIPELIADSQGIGELTHHTSSTLKDIKIFSSISSRFSVKSNKTRDQQYLFTPLSHGNSESEFLKCSFRVSNASKPFSSFFDVLFYPNASSFFLEFVESQFSAENFLFWKEVELFRAQETSNTRYLMARQIFTRFIHQGRAEQEINIPSHCRNSFTKIYGQISLHSCPKTLFDGPQAEIWELMKRDTWPNFKKSEFYTSLLKYIRQQSVSWFDQETIKLFVTKTKHTTFSDYPGSSCCVHQFHPESAESGSKTERISTGRRLSLTIHEELAAISSSDSKTDRSLSRDSSTDTIGSSSSSNDRPHSPITPPHTRRGSTEKLSPSPNQLYPKRTMSPSSDTKHARSKSIDIARFGGKPPKSRPTSPLPVGTGGVGVGQSQISSSSSSSSSDKPPIPKKKGSTLIGRFRSSSFAGKKSTKSGSK